MVKMAKEKTPPTLLVDGHIIFADTLSFPIKLSLVEAFGTGLCCNIGPDPRQYI